MNLEIVVLTWNRRAFTRFTLATLLANTDWDIVSRLVVYDDTSSDGIRDELDELLAGFPVDTVLCSERFRSPPATMNHHLRHTTADAFVKLDSDIAVPPGWLSTLVGVAEEHPSVDLLGMEGGRMGVPRQEPLEYGYTLCSHIGGVGLMRTRAFRGVPLIPENGRFGFTEWQQQVGAVRAWITPDILCAELDKVPCEPWMSLSERYIGEGWQRQWAHYDPKFPYWWEWFDPALVAWAVDNVEVPA